MKLRYKNIVYFILLFLFLFLSLFLRAIDRNLEVFPSVTLPSFANQVRLDKEVSLQEKELYGIDDVGNKKRLDHTKFFKNIPIQFSHTIMANNFGLDRSQPSQLVTARFKIKYTVGSKVTEKEIAETKEWLRQRLRDQNCRDSILILDRRKITIHDNGHIDYAKFSVNDTIYRLR